VHNSVRLYCWRVQTLPSKAFWQGLRFWSPSSVSLFGRNWSRSGL